MSFGGNNTSFDAWPVRLAAETCWCAELERQMCCYKHKPVYCFQTTSFQNTMVSTDHPRVTLSIIHGVKLL
jgi:hypothetical protein